MDRRQEILEAAARSFTLFGYKATTMEQVAKIANVGKGTIYTFFANKEILFQEISYVTCTRDESGSGCSVGCISKLYG